MDLGILIAIAGLAVTIILAVIASARRDGALEARVKTQEARSDTRDLAIAEQKRQQDRVLEAQIEMHHAVDKRVIAVEAQVRTLLSIEATLKELFARLGEIDRTQAASTATLTAVRESVDELKQMVRRPS